MRVPTHIRVNQGSGWWGSNQTAAFERLTATIAKWRKDRSREPQRHVQMLFIMTQSQLDTELYQLSNTGRLPFITRRRRRECTCRRLSWQVSLSMRHGVKSVLPPGESIWLYACSCSWPGIISEVCPNFFAVARFSFGGGGVAIRYVLPVLWMTSCAPTISQTKATQLVRSVEVGRTWRILRLTHQGSAPNRGGVWYLWLPCCFLYVHEHLSSVDTLLPIKLVYYYHGQSLHMFKNSWFRQTRP